MAEFDYASWPLSKALFRRDDIGGVDKLVMWALVMHVNKDTGRCNPGLDTLARVTGLDEKTVRRSIKRLTSSGVLTVNRPRRNDVAQYTLILERAESPLDAEEDTDPERTLCPSRADSLSLPSGLSAQRTSEERSDEQAIPALPRRSPETATEAAAARRQSRARAGHEVIYSRIEDYSDDQDVVRIVSAHQDNPYGLAKTIEKEIIEMDGYVSDHNRKVLSVLVQITDGADHPGVLRIWETYCCDEGA